MQGGGVVPKTLLFVGTEDKFTMTKVDWSEIGY